MLLLLCFLWSLGSLRSDLLRNLTLHPVPPMEKQAVPFALLAVTAALFALVRRTDWPRGRRLLPPVLVGLGLFVAPAVLVSLSSKWVPELARVALFSLAAAGAIDNSAPQRLSRGGSSLGIVYCHQQQSTSMRSTMRAVLRFLWS